MEVGQEVWVKGTVKSIDLTDDTILIEANGNRVWYGNVSPDISEYSAQEVFEVMKKIGRNDNHGGVPLYVLSKIFGTADIDFILGRPLKEIMQRIKKYEDENMIKIGDVIKLKNDNSVGVVTGINCDRMAILWNDGSVGSCDIADLIKTGKYMDIESTIKEIDK